MPKTNLQYAQFEQPQARNKIAFAPYAQSPMHGFGLAAMARRQDDSCGVWMNEVPMLGYVIVRGDAQDPAFNGAVKSVLGIVLPTVPGTFVAFEQGIALWQAPDEWLLVCIAGARQSCIDGLEGLLKGMHAQVVDNSGGLTMLYLSGRHQVTLLRHVGVYDFESLSAGRVVSTVCGKAAFTVLRHDDHGIFAIVRRSFSDYAWRLLSKAARPYGLGIAALDPRPSHPVLRLL